VDIIGHQKIVNQLDKALEKGNFSHAYLFAGSEHVGKFTVALGWAEKLLGTTSVINPNLIILRPEIEEKNGVIKKKAISVEDVRELQKKLIMTATESKFKIAIIDDADYLNTSAQNALLKTLEEPANGVILILIAQNKEKLLPTIISRCQTKKFNPVSSDELDKILDNNQYREEIIFWSLGRPGLARMLSEDKTALRERQESFQEFKNLFSQNITERFILAENISKNAVGMIDKLNWWLVMLRESILSPDYALNISQEKALRVAEKTGESIRILKETNSNPRLIMENLMLEF
jgi:DNA polymerase-3 subunit delta'